MSNSKMKNVDEKKHTTNSPSFFHIDEIYNDYITNQSR